MSKKKDYENKDKDVKETALDTVEPKLEDTEDYKKASFGEKVSLKFRKRLIANGFHTTILVLLIIAIVWAINLWADQKNLAQIDVTKNHLYSLTQISKDTLKNLNKDVKIYVYGYNKTDDIVQFLAQYNSFNNKISYEIINETNNYDLITKYSLGTTKALVVVCGDKDRTIYPDYEFTSSDSTSGDTINLAEEVITNAILKVTTDDPVKIYYATGNGEYDKDSLYLLSTYLEEEVFEVADLNLLSITEIPSDCDVLAIIGPEEDLTSSQADIIKNYVNNAGNLLVCATLPANKEFPNLQSVLDLYGASIKNGILYEDNSNNYLAYQNSLPLHYVLIPGYSSESPITADFSKTNSRQMVIMPWSQSIDVKDVSEENVTVSNTEILTSSSSCYNIENYSNGITSELLKSLQKSTYTIGSEFTRTMKDGNNSKESKLVLYANSSFMLDSYKDSNIQIATMSNAGNVNLVMNTFAELADEKDLITVRKSANVTEFKSTESENKVVKLIIFGIPVLIIVVGIIIWNKRKNKR